MATRTLIVYYSFSGNTRKLVQSLIAALGGAKVDVEEILEPRPRRGLAGGLRAAGSAALRRASSILMPLHRAGDYDVVLLGTPIWMGRVATPVRAYLRSQAWGRARLGLFSTSAGPVGLAPLREIERIVGRPVASRLHLIARETPGVGQIRAFLEPLGLATQPMLAAALDDTRATTQGVTS